MTLMVFADEEDDRQDIGETMFELMRSHPSRAIVVKIRQAPGNSGIARFRPVLEAAGTGPANLLRTGRADRFSGPARRSSFHRGTIVTRPICRASSGSVPAA